jgi:hypothetical protein
MTDLELLQLDAIDRAERKLREIGTHPSLTTKEKWLRLLEAVRDDAFVDLEDLIGPDLPFDAYWSDEEEPGTGWLSPGGSPIWWPVCIYNRRPPGDHSFWQGKYAFGDTPEKSKKRKKKAWSSNPPNTFDQPSPAKVAASPERTEKSALSVFKRPGEVSVISDDKNKVAGAIARDDREVEELMLLGVI